MRERGRGQILYQQSQSKTGSKDVDNGASKRVLWCEERKKKVMCGIDVVGNTVINHIEVKELIKKKRV